LRILYFMVAAQKKFTKQEAAKVLETTKAILYESAESQEYAEYLKRVAERKKIIDQKIAELRQECDALPNYLDT
jgi:hypothetical protein